MSIKLTNNNKTREDRLSFHQKALRPKILSRIPSDREGSDGDIMLGHTSDGDKLFAKINGKWVIFEVPKPLFSYSCLDRRMILTISMFRKKTGGKS